MVLYSSVFTPLSIQICLSAQTVSSSYVVRRGNENVHFYALCIVHRGTDHRMFDFVLCPLLDFGSVLCILLNKIQKKVNYCDKNNSMINMISEDNIHQNCNDLNHLYYLVQRTCIGKQISTNMKSYTHTQTLTYIFTLKH